MKRLYTPFKVNKLELKNRVIMSPMSIGHTVDGFIMDDVVEFYKRRAELLHGQTPCRRDLHR